MQSPNELFTQFYKDLSNNDNNKYNELIKFSQDIINGTLNTKKIYNIVGSGSNGKSTFIKCMQMYIPSVITLLDILTDDDFIYQHNNMYFIIPESEYIELDKTFCHYKCDPKELDPDCYKVSHQCLLKKLTGGDCLYYNNGVFTPHITFIIVTNTPLTGDLALQKRIQHIEMNATFKNNINMYDTLKIYKNELKQFILQQ